MADDFWYNPGDNYLLDDNTGFKIRASKAKMQWDNILTSDPAWSPRQPQDLVVGVRDEQVAALVRSRQVNQFTVVATIVTAPAMAGATSMMVESAAGFQAGDLCQVVLDNGDIFNFTLSAVTSDSLAWVSPPLPSPVGSAFGSPLENQVVDLTRS